MAINYAGEYLRSERLRRSMSYGDAARLCGAITSKQISRVAQRLVLFERESVRDRGLLQNVITAFDLDPVIVNQLLDRQRDEELAEWNAWADEPAPIALHVRPFAGMWLKLRPPDEAAGDEWLAIEYAKKMTAPRPELRVVLALGRRRSLTIAGGEIIATMEATPGRSMTPFVEIDGGRIVFEASE